MEETERAALAAGVITQAELECWRRSLEAALPARLAYVMKVRAQGTSVALTIDCEVWPAHSETVDGEISEYAEITQRYLGEEQHPVRRLF